MITILAMWVNAHYKLRNDEIILLTLIPDILGIVCTAALISEFIAKI